MRIIQRGLDTSDRPLRQSEVMWAWWDEYVARLGFEPVMVKGGHQAAEDDASSTTHLGDAADVRTRDRTPAQVERMVKVARAMGAAAWVRDERHGFDPHIHLAPGAWAFPSASALRQWHACRDGRDGLASNGPDYHPYPLAPTWKADELMAAADDILKAITEAKNELLAAELETRSRLGERDNARKRADAALRAQLLKRFDATDADVDEILALVRAAEQD